MKHVHSLQSDKCPAFRSTRRYRYQIPRENMSHLIKFILYPSIERNSGPVRMCTVRKHTKLKGPQTASLPGPDFSFFFLSIFPFSPNTKLRLHAMLFGILSKIFYIYNRGMYQKTIHVLRL